MFITVVIDIKNIENCGRVEVFRFKKLLYPTGSAFLFPLFAVQSSTKL